jgi:hypothetical protein
MAVLVAQEHPDTIRRTPARGDGGIDLLVPSGNGYDVYQVKGFTGRVGASQRRQVEHSWGTVREDARLSRPIVGYKLVVPIDPTPDEQKWFDALTEGSPWEPRWLGQVFWDAQAALYPHVIDYFFAGGQEKVAKRVRALQSALTDPRHPITPADVMTSLEMLRAALNRDDPHYEYDFQITRDKPDTSGLSRAAALHSTFSIEGGTFLTVTVYPRHRYSLHDSPITTTLEMAVPQQEVTPALREAIRDFEHFGRAVEFPVGTVIAEINAPAGLGGRFEGGSVKIGPALLTTTPPPMRLVVRTPNDTTVCEVKLLVQQVTRGPAGGVEVSLSDESGFISATLQISPPDQQKPDSGHATLTWSVAPLGAAPVMRALPVVRFVTALTPPNTIELRPEFGNAVIAASALDAPVDYAPSGWIVHLEDLAVVQQHVSRTILVPETVEPEFVNGLHPYARMLAGEQINGTWDEVEARLIPGVTRASIQEQLEGGGPLAWDRQIAITLGGEDLELGAFTTILMSVRLAEEQPKDEERFRLVPAADNSFVQRTGRHDQVAG